MSTHQLDRPPVAASVPGHVDGVDVLDGPGGRHPASEGHRTGHDHPLAPVWRLLISMRTGLVLILALVFLTFAGTLLIQATGGAAADPAAYQAWYEAGPRLKYGGWAPVLSALGLFNVFGTWYFRALFALLGVSILACSVNRAPRLWRVATKPRTSMGEVFFTHAPLRATFDLPVDVEAAAARVRTGLKRSRFRVLDGTAARGADLYGDRHRWGPFGTVLAHLSFVVILAGFVVSASAGFKDAEFVAPVGIPVEVGHETGLVVTANSFNDSYYPDGSPKDYVSDLTLTRDGVEVARHDTRVNDPLIFDDVWFHQSFFGVGADLVVAKDGQEVLRRSVPLLFQSDDGQQSIGRFDVADPGIDEVWVISAASGQVLADLPAGTVALEVHRPGVERPEVQVVAQGTSVDIAGLTWTYERSRAFTGLTIKRDPGSSFIWVGSILLIIGSCLVFFLPHRRVWARVRPNDDGTSTVMIAAPNKRDPALEPVFAEIVHRIQAADEQPVR